MMKLEDIQALSAKAAQGLPLSDEELLGVEEWYATLDMPCADYHVAELDRYVSDGALRELTDAEVARIEWHAKQLVVIIPFSTPLESHPLTAFVTNFCKITRPGPAFSHNFKKVNPAVMPHLFKVVQRTQRALPLK